MATETPASEEVDTTDDEAPTAAICPVCLTVATRDDAETAHEVAEEHNANLHDGEHVARSVEPKAKHIVAFRNRIEREHGERTRREVDGLIAEREPWGGL